MPAEIESLGGDYAVVLAGDYTANTRVFPPTAATLLTASRANPAFFAEALLATGSTFEVTYNGFSVEAQKAFQAAVDVWSVLLTSTVTIKVNATWADIADTRVLGSARAGTSAKNFSSAPKTDTWYPIALANKLAGSDLAASEPDIVANFNKNNADWYFGTDGNPPPGKFDLMSVVLHELGHGLGFAGTMGIDAAGIGSWGRNTTSPGIYDRFAENLSGESLLNTALFPNKSLALAGQLTSDRLVFVGANARAANAGNPPRLYAPLTWRGGSSFSHLDETIFASGSSNSLMTPQIGRGEVIHSPGPIVLGVLSDFGW